MTKLICFTNTVLVRLVSLPFYVAGYLFHWMMAFAFVGYMRAGEHQKWIISRGKK